MAVLYSKLGQEDKSTKCLSKLLSLSDNVCGGDPSLPDEVLYGRAGYLFSLLFAQKHLGEQKIPHDIINQVWYVDLHLWVVQPDPGKGPRGPAPLSFLDQTEAQKAEKKFLEITGTGNHL